MNWDLLPCGEDCENCPHPDCIYEKEERKPAKPQRPGRDRKRSRPQPGGELSEASLEALRRLWAQRDRTRAELTTYKAEQGMEPDAAVLQRQSDRKARNAEKQRRYRQRRKEMKREEVKDGATQYW